MKRITRRAIGWILAGGAFVAVVATPGCTSSHRDEREVLVTTPAPIVATAAQAPATPVVQNDDGGDVIVTQTINAFGEINGQQRPTARQSGDGGFQQHTFTDEGYDSDVAIDPTGKLIAYASTRNSEHSDIYVQRVDGTAVTQLTSDANDDAFPTFSPDGRSIAFSSTRSGTWQIYTMDNDGKSVVQITSGTNQAVHPSYSPDGSRLVYSSLGGRSGQWELWTVNLTTGEKRMIGYGLFPTWSPDKNVDRIAFQKARQRGSRWFSLWTLDLTDGQARKITEIAAATNSAVVSPTWSPDGKHLAFSTVVDPSLPGKGKSHGQQDVWTVNADGSNRVRITDGNGLNLSPIWAVDNRIYFISDRSGIETVWSTQVQVTPALAETNVKDAIDTKSTPEATGHKVATKSNEEKSTIGQTADTHEVEH